MKHILLKTVQTTIAGKATSVHYRDQIQEVMSTASPQGATLDEMRRSIRVLDAVEALEGSAKVLELEDADFEYMKQRVLATKWPVIDRALLQFVEDVTNPKE